jgi:membrane protein DedA with SNARE-associated domain
MAEWITNTMNSLGYLGIGLLMFLENLFPPIPSELIMPLAGFTATQPGSKIQLLPAILAGVLGTVLGALPWYYAGKFVGDERLKRWADRYGRWLTISGKDIERADRWFDRHGGKAVFICRLVPGIRTIISLPAGVSEMHLAPFLLYSTLGTALWVSLLAYAGYALGENYELVDEYLAPVSKIVLATVVIGFIIWLVRRNMRR